MSLFGEAAGLVLGAVAVVAAIILLIRRIDADDRRYIRSLRKDR